MAELLAALPGRVGEAADDSAGMVRREVHCSNCGGIWDTSSRTGRSRPGLRYCINGLALAFVA
jgi:peptide-methionine (R)-S-oxide reductase